VISILAKINHKNIVYLTKVFIISIAISMPVFPQLTSATSYDCDQIFLAQNNIGHLSPPGCDNSVCTNISGSYDPKLSILKDGSALDYAGNTALSDAQIKAIKDNEQVYRSSALKAGIPWEMLAAVHYRETGLKNYGPRNGNGPYQIVGNSYPIADSYTPEEFQKASDDAANFIKSKSNGLSLSNFLNVEFTFFAYNGASSQYINQALALGFAQEEANDGAGSPYVMNQMDQKRDPRDETTSTNSSWGQIKKDGGSIEYPANSGDGQYGAFVIYSLLIGADITGARCSGTSGKNIDATSLQTEFADYMKANKNNYGAYALGYNGCTTLAAWFIGTHTNLTYGGGNGGSVVDNLLSKNSSLKKSTTPVAPSVFSVAGGAATWGGSGDSITDKNGNVVYPGHVGLVLSVDEANKTVTALATGSGYDTDQKRSFISVKYSYPNKNVTFVYVGDNLK